MAKINLSQLPACVEDARLAWLDTDRGPPDPTKYATLLTRLNGAPAKLPPLYRDAAAEPSRRYSIWAPIISPRF
jgi:hypothetical protein